ncbi:signal peptidase II [Nocardia takedensis]|uniref:signal peptidase II n=1 Tax=Nocardia takedensis TaxID=259390 RepID=UPI000594E891|nr:signal peptidase II [Nocardia takedensis]
MSIDPVVTPSPATGRAAIRHRVTVYVIAAGMAGIDLAAKVWAQRRLAGNPIELGPVDLRLAFNPGVAFSMGAGAPTGVVLAVTGLITACMAVAVWRWAPTANTWWRTGFAAILGGAIANVVDRAPDGVVTDYLRTGWWPTFNLADSLIVVGAIGLCVLTVFGSSPDGRRTDDDA